MDETVMRILDDDDGEPNMPFYFVWANEAFIWKWKTQRAGRVSTLARGDTQVPQNYPENGWRPHFDYLLRFFRHRNYYRVDGKPVFALYKDDGDVVSKMFRTFRQWAVEAGLPGLYLMLYLQGSNKEKRGAKPGQEFRLVPWADAIQTFGRSSTIRPRPTWLPLQVGWSIGLWVDFDNTARLGTEHALVWEEFDDAPPEARQRGRALPLAGRLEQALNLSLSQNRTQHNMILIVAFNEWSEQAMLEPSDGLGVSRLEGIRSVLRRYGQYRVMRKENSSGVGHWNRAADAQQRETSQLTDCAPRKVSLPPPSAAGRFGSWLQG